MGFHQNNGKKEIKNYFKASQRKLRQKIKLLETKYKKYTLKNIDNFFTSNVLNSKKTPAKRFVQSFDKKSKIIETFIEKLYKKIKLSNIITENKNLSILQKLIKTLERLNDFEIKIPLNYKTCLKLGTISKFENLPLKNLSRIYKLTIACSPGRNFINYYSKILNKLDFPPSTFSNIFYSGTFLRIFEQERKKNENKSKCRIGVIYSKNIYQSSGRISLNLILGSNKKWKLTRCTKEMLQFLINKKSPRTLSDHRNNNKRWQQVLDSKTGSFYYWDLLTETVSWEATSHGFVPIKTKSDCYL